MIKIILFIAIVLLGFRGYTQNIYFGYPSDFKNLTKDDKIIVNIPFHRDGKFVKLEDFDMLVSLLGIKQDSKIKIEINLFMGLADSDLMYCKSLARSLTNILKYKYDGENYEILANGNNNPIFARRKKSRKLYKKHNTRMEITL